jgi:hypothetical protein
MGVRDLKEAKDWESSQNSAFANLKRNISPFQLLAVAGLFVLAYYLLLKSGLNKNFVFGCLIAVVIFIIWKSDMKQKKVPIPENIIKIICLNLMRRKIGGEYPNGTMIMTLPYCGLLYQGAWGLSWKEWKWEVGVRIIYPDYLKEDLVVCLHPYEGYITKIYEMPAGYTGQESQDVKILTPEVYSIETDKQTGGQSLKKD